MGAETIMINDEEDNEALSWSSCEHGPECRLNSCQKELLRELHEESRDK